MQSLYQFHYNTIISTQTQRRLKKTDIYRIFSIKRRTPIKRRPRLNAGSELLIFLNKRRGRLFEVPASNRGPGVYLRRANKYRYSLEKQCYDTYCTVYCFCYFNKCLTNKSGVTLLRLSITCGLENSKINREMRFSLPSIKCSEALPSFRLLPRAW